MVSLKKVLWNQTFFEKGTQINLSKDLCQKLKTVFAQTVSSEGLKGEQCKTFFPNHTQKPREIFKSDGINMRKSLMKR